MAVVSPIPADKAATEVKPIYEALTQKFGRMPNIFGVMAHRPAVLKNFMPLYGSIINEGTVEAKYKELAYLKTALLNGCEYCTRAHTPGGRKGGLSDDQIRAIHFYERSKLFDEKEKATLRYAERVTRGAAGIRSPELEELRKFYSEDQIVELTLVICAANFTNRFNDALQIEPDLG